MRHILTSLFLSLSLVASAQTVTDTTVVQSDTRTIINSFLSELMEFSKDAGAFAKEQVPLVLKEYIYWGIAEGVVMVVLCMGWIAVFVYVIKRWAMKASADDFGAFFFMAAGSILSIVAVFEACESILQATKAIVAPRVYLIDTLSDLIK